MIYAPIWSLVLALTGFLLGELTSGDQLALILVGAGSLIGYLIWIWARLKAIPLGMPFHLGSFVATALCTEFCCGNPHQAFNRQCKK